MPLVDKLAKSKYKYLGFIISPIEIIFMNLLPLMTGYEVNPYIEIIMDISCLGWFTYYYLGYMLGNNIRIIKTTTKKIVYLWVISVALQTLEGYWYLSMDETNCGTQLKLSSILTGVIFAVIAYRFANSEKLYNIKMLKVLGDCSFGIYFSHLAIMSVLGKMPYYSEYIFYPFNAIIAVLISFVCVLIGRMIMGKYSKYLAL